MRRLSLCFTPSSPPAPRLNTPLYPQPCLFYLICLSTTFTPRLDYLLSQPSPKTDVSLAAVLCWRRRFSHQAGRVKHLMSHVKTQNCSPSLSCPEPCGSFAALPYAVFSHKLPSQCSHSLVFEHFRPLPFCSYACCCLGSHQSSFPPPDKTLASPWRVS